MCIFRLLFLLIGSMNKLLNLPYFGSVWHWAQLASPGVNIIEAHGNYLRRTFRSRTTIMSANGPISLTVPVYSNNDEPYSLSRINYSTDWAGEHLNAFRSAYNASPFYEFYEDDFKAIYNRHHEKLWDLNIDLMNLVAELIDIELNLDYTEDYIKNPEDCMDLRIGIEHKRGDALKEGLREVPYYQVFKDRYGFVGGMSILDLLFNMGPEGKLVLLAMIQ